MQASFEDACVTDWEELVAGISLPDRDGRPGRADPRPARARRARPGRATSR